MKRPHEYLKVVASLMPKQVEVDGHSYVARLPEPAKDAETWLANLPRVVVDAEEIPTDFDRGQRLVTNNRSTE